MLSHDVRRTFEVHTPDDGGKRVARPNSEERCARPSGNTSTAPLSTDAPLVQPDAADWDLASGCPLAFASAAPHQAALRDMTVSAVDTNTGAARDHRLIPSLLHQQPDERTDRHSAARVYFFFKKKTRADTGGETVFAGNCSWPCAMRTPCSSPALASTRSSRRGRSPTRFGASCLCSCSTRGPRRFASRACEASSSSCRPRAPTIARAHARAAICGAAVQCATAQRSVRSVRVARSCSRRRAPSTRSAPGATAALSTPRRHRRRHRRRRHRRCSCRRPHPRHPRRRRAPRAAGCRPPP